MRNALTLSSVWSWLSIMDDVILMIVTLWKAQNVKRSRWTPDAESVTLSTIPPHSFLSLLFVLWERSFPPLYSWLYTCIHKRIHTTCIYVSFPFCLFEIEEQNRNVMYHLQRKSRYQFLLTVQTKANTAWSSLPFMWEKMSKMWLPPVGWINQCGRHACVSVVHPLS